MVDIRKALIKILDTKDSNAFFKGEIPEEPIILYMQLNEYIGDFFIEDSEGKMLNQKNYFPSNGIYFNEKPIDNFIVIMEK